MRKFNTNLTTCLFAPKFNLFKRVLFFNKNILSCVFLIAVLLISNAVFGQPKLGKYPSTDTVTIIINGESNTVQYLNSKVVNQDGVIRVEIKNINLFLYDVFIKEIQNTSISTTPLNEQPVNITTNLKLLNPETLAIKDVLLKRPLPSKNIDSLARLSDAIKVLTFQLDIKKVEIKKIEKAIDEVKTEIINYRPLENIVDTSNQRNLKIKALNLNLDTLANALKKSQQELNDFELLLIAKENKLNLIYKTTQDVNEKLALFALNFNTYRESVVAVQDLVDVYNELVIIATTSGVSFNEFVMGRDEILSDHFNTNSPVQVMMKINNANKFVSDAFNYLTQAYNLFTNEEITDLNLEVIYDYLLSYNEKLKSVEINNIKNNISVLINGIDESNYFCSYTTGIIKDDADLISYQVVLTPKTSENSILTPKPITNAFEVRIRHGVKIDYSAGLFANLLLADNTYSILPYGDVGPDGSFDSSIVQLNKSEDLFLPSVGALIHLYRRTPRDLKLSLSTGVSISQNQAATYYLGGSAIFGRTQRIIFSGGIAGKQVKTATNIYKPGTILAMNPTSVSSIDFLDNSPFKVGVFLGVTYNLSSGVKPTGFTSFLTNQ